MNEQPGRPRHDISARSHPEPRPPHRRESSGFAAAAALLLALVLALAVAPPARAAGHGEPGPVFPVEIALRDRQADLKLLTELGIDLDGVFFDRARAYVIAEEMEKLAALGFDAAPIPEETLLPGLLEEGPLAAQYHTYATLTSELQQIAQDHASITSLVSLGQSVQGRELWMMKITDNPDLEEDEPEFHYIAAMHGDEVVGKENCINLINLLTDSYPSDPRVKALVDATEIWILPSMNPDGTELHQRYNANGYDLNRNFPDQFHDPNNSPAGRPIEIQRVMNWGYARTPTLSANFHGGAMVANYPRDGNAAMSSVYTATPQDSLFVSLARTYADNNPSMLASNGDPSYNNGICNGADWYVIYGGMQDWWYVWEGGNDITLEIGTKWPAAQELTKYWNDNSESMLAYMERIHEGVRGFVTDAVTGAPLKASVRVAGIDWVTYSDPDLGDYHRMLLPGRYALEVSATGYATSVEPDVVVAAGGPEARRDFALQPLDVNLEHQSHRILDGAGGDGWLDPGETADLAVTLRNLGLSATGVSGMLEPTDWFGQATRAAASYPDIAAGASAESLAPHHEVTLGTAVPPGHKVGFAVRWASSQGSGTAGPFFLPAGGQTCATVASTDVPRAIQDRQTATSTLTFPSDLEVSEVNAYVNISHTYKGDLQVTLVSPSGTPIFLHDRSGGSADNIIGWYDAALTPAEPLSRFDAEHSTGTWTLKVNDGVPTNTGTLNSWSVEVCGRPFEASTPEMRLRDVTLETGKVILTWWPYPGMTSYKMYRSTSPTPASFVNVTPSDPDPTDTRFEDTTPGTLYYLVSGVGPAGEGPR